MNVFDDQSRSHAFESKVRQGWAEYIRERISDRAWFATLTFKSEVSERGALRALTRWLRRLIAEGAHRLSYFASVDRGEENERTHLHVFIDNADPVTPMRAEQLWKRGISRVDSAHEEGARRYLADKAVRGTAIDVEGNAKLLLQDAVRAALTPEPSSVLQIALRLRPSTPDRGLYRVPAPVISKQLRRLVSEGAVISVRDETGATLWARR